VVAAARRTRAKHRGQRDSAQRGKHLSLCQVASGTEAVRPRRLNRRQSLHRPGRCGFEQLANVVDQCDRTNGKNAERRQDHGGDGEAMSLGTDCPEKAAAITTTVPGLNDSASAAIILVGS
jgi:hypothetical protein